MAACFDVKLTDTQMELLDAWLRSILWEGRVPFSDTDCYQSVAIHRLKGRVVREDGRVMLIQGVREVYEIFDASERGMVVARDNLLGKIVFIGRKLEGVDIGGSLRWFVLEGNGTLSIECPS